MRCEIPFRLRDRDGTCHVAVTPNLDPDGLGHGLVAVGYDADAFVGFPCVTAEIEYDGSGPRAWMGWVQVVVRHDTDGTATADLDAVPLLGEGSPLYAFGYKPTFSDFPANPGHPDGDWVADAFLVEVPDVVRSRRLRPVLGFRWGYRLAGGRPVELFAPQALAPDAWEAHRDLFEARCPDWTFDPA